MSRYLKCMVHILQSAYLWMSGEIRSPEFSSAELFWLTSGYLLAYIIFLCTCMMENQTPTPTLTHFSWVCPIDNYYNAQMLIIVIAIVKYVPDDNGLIVLVDMIDRYTWKFPILLLNYTPNSNLLSKSHLPGFIVWKNLKSKFSCVNLLLQKIKHISMFIV